MNQLSSLEATLDQYVDEKADRLVGIARELIRLPSENTPPAGAEQACQHWLASQLSACGLVPDLYTFDQVSGLQQHALFHAGRNYTSRPNLGARRAGLGGGRSLLLSGHIDTVPRGTQPWTDSPFSARVDGNRLYGRGANDMKAGIAMNLFAVECLTALDIRLTGDLVFESVVDEEFGGSNGTLAGRLRGHNADAALLAEPSALRICPAQRGGRTAHLSFKAPAAGVLDGAGTFPKGVIPQLTYFLAQLETFAVQRSIRSPAHEMYPPQRDPVPVSVTKVFTSPWGFQEPITIPDTAQVELYWQTMPGETQADVEREFFDWMETMLAGAPSLFPTPPHISFPIRWLPGSSIARSEPLVCELSACATSVLHREPVVAGIEGPCDLFVFQQGFGIPAALWGPAGGNTHAADEYVEIDSLLLATKTLLRFIVQWCGVARN